MALLQADIDQLNRLSGALNGVGEAIDALEIRSAVAGIHTALPGCEAVAAACTASGESTEWAWLQVAERFRKLSQLVATTAADVNATDQVFEDRLQSMSFRRESD